MSKGVVLSFILHLVLILTIVFGLPTFMNKDLPEFTVVTVEILPVTGITNVAPPKPKPTPKKEEKPKETATPNKPKIALPDPKDKPEPEKKAEPTPKPEPVKPKVAEKPKEVVKVKPLEPIKPEPKKEEVKKKEEPKMKEDAFASVLKSVEQFEPQPDEKKDDKKEEADFSEVEDFLSNLENQPQYKPGLPLSLNEKDAIRQQIMRNWTVLGGAKEAEDLIVSLRIELAPDGTVTSVEVENNSKYNSNPFYRAMADSAVRAVHKSSPLQNLPAEKYDVKDGWRELVLNFDPREMLY